MILKLDSLAYFLLLLVFLPFSLAVQFSYDLAGSLSLSMLITGLSFSCVCLIKASPLLLDLETLINFYNMVTSILQVIPSFKGGLITLLSDESFQTSFLFL